MLIKYGCAILLLLLGYIIQSPVVADSDSAASVQNPGRINRDTVRTQARQLITLPALPVSHADEPTTDALSRSVVLDGPGGFLLAAWMQLSAGQLHATLLKSHQLTMFEQIARGEVANRLRRLEPRDFKRRRHGFILVMTTQNELRRELRTRCT